VGKDALRRVLFNTNMVQLKTSVNNLKNKSINMLYSSYIPMGIQLQLYRAFSGNVRERVGGHDQEPRGIQHYR
jgi:hypothetical protein